MGKLGGKNMNQIFVLEKESSNKPLGDSRENQHLQFEVGTKRSFMGVITLIEEERAADEGDLIIAGRLDFDLNERATGLFPLIINECLMSLKKIENMISDVSVFGTIKILTENSEITEAAKQNGFEQNNGELILNREKFLQAINDHKIINATIPRRKKKPVTQCTLSEDDQRKILEILTGRGSGIYQTFLYKLIPLDPKYISNAISYFENKKLLDTEKSGNKVRIIPKVEKIKALLETTQYDREY